MPQAWQHYNLALTHACATIEGYARTGSSLAGEGRVQALSALLELERAWGDAERARLAHAALSGLFCPLPDIQATPAKVALDAIAQWMRDLEEDALREG